jgi:hypothetical protein
MQIAFQTCSECAGGEVATGQNAFICTRLTDHWKQTHPGVPEVECDLPPMMNAVETAKPGTEAPELDGLTEPWIRGHVVKDVK